MTAYQLSTQKNVLKQSFISLFFACCQLLSQQRRGFGLLWLSLIVQLTLLSLFFFSCIALQHRNHG
jgi:hypothetical protein